MMLTILTVERRASPPGHDAAGVKGGTGETSLCRTPEDRKKWTAGFLQPRSGDTGKPGASVPGSIEQS